MSQIGLNELLLVVTELQRTVHSLASRIDGEVRQTGQLEINGPEATRDDTGCTVEHSDEGEVKRGFAAVACDDSSVVDEQKNMANGTTSVVEESADSGQSIASCVSGVASMPISFGGFDGAVPLQRANASRDTDGNSESGSASSSLIEVDKDSWSDLVEREIEQGGGGVEEKDRVERFFKDYVRAPEVTALSKFLRGEGIVIRKDCMEELSLSRYTAATVPVVFKNGKARLKGLALVGDKFMAALVCDVMYREGKTSNEIQDFLSSKLTRIRLSPICVNSGLGRFIVAPSGVDLGSTAVGGEALEAIAGVVYHSGGLDALRKFCVFLQLL